MKARLNNVIERERKIILTKLKLSKKKKKIEDKILKLKK